MTYITLKNQAKYRLQPGSMIKTFIKTIKTIPDIQ